MKVATQPPLLPKGARAGGGGGQRMMDQNGYSNVAFLGTLAREQINVLGRHVDAQALPSQKPQRQESIQGYTSRTLPRGPQRGESIKLATLLMRSKGPQGCR